MKLTTLFQGRRGLLLSALVLAAAAASLIVPAHADPIKVTPALANFKQIAPRTVELVFSVNVQEAVPTGYMPFIHVIDKRLPNDKSIVFQIGSGIAAKPETWTVGKTVVGSLVTLPIDKAVGDGEYDIRYGLYDAIKGPRLELTGNDDGERRYTIGKLVIAGPTITAPGVPLVTPAQEGRLNITPSATDLAQAGPRAFTYRLNFDVKDKVPAGELVFAHLTYAVTSPGKDNIVSIDPGIATDPATWTIGQKVTGDIVTVTLPTDLADGAYTVRIGLYASKTDGRRLLISGVDDGGQRYIIAKLTVSANGAKIVLEPVK
ncbi:MAG TPA: hypothetical protein VGK19_23340 [Capsulimonadaceae bacterium]|jgi:hypothetical protein